MTKVLISGGLVLAVLIEPKILRISSALSLPLRYLFKFVGILSLDKFSWATRPRDRMNGRHILPNSCSNSTSNCTPDLGPQSQQRDDRGHVLVRNGRLGRHTGTNDAECTAEGNENLGPDERDITT